MHEHLFAMKLSLLSTHTIYNQYHTWYDREQCNMNENTFSKCVGKQILFLITQLCLLHKVKTKMKPLFHPYQTHPHPDYLGSFVQRFSLKIKERDNTDKHFPLRTKRWRTNTVPYIKTGVNINIIYDLKWHEGTSVRWPETSSRVQTFYFTHPIKRSLETSNMTTRW